MPSDYEVIIRLGLACVLGGLVGVERERNRHPAGLRTHILVCIGSALVMLCNLYIFEAFKGKTNIDPARLGAQVISGIGFLGAGTILKEGITVRGLTTAASLWAVACIGISIGIGFYKGAALATFLVLVILIILSKFEHLLYGKTGSSYLKIKTVGRPGQIGKIGTELGANNVSIMNISTETLDDSSILLKIRIDKGRCSIDNRLLEQLSDIDGVKYVEVSDF